MVKYIAHEQVGYFCKDVEVWVNRKLKNIPYGQAGILENDNGIHLMSYSTMICTIDKNGWLMCDTWYGSRTTKKHINAFFREFAPEFTANDLYRLYANDEVINTKTGEVMKLSEYAKVA